MWNPRTHSTGTHLDDKYLILGGGQPRSAQKSKIAEIAEIAEKWSKMGFSILSFPHKSQDFYSGAGIMGYHG